MNTIKDDVVNDPGCTMMNCPDFRGGICHYDSPICRYRQDEIDPEDLRDAERFQWLINRGVAWRGCYKNEWKEGEWLYAIQDARKIIDSAMKE